MVKVAINKAVSLLQYVVVAAVMDPEQASENTSVIAGGGSRLGERTSYLGYVRTHWCMTDVISYGAYLCFFSSDFSFTFSTFIA